MIIHADYATLKHLFSKKDAKPRLLKWIFLLQEFDCEIQNRNGFENFVANRLSQIIVEKESESTYNCFPNEQLLRVRSEPWYPDIINYLVIGEIPLG